MNEENNVKTAPKAKKKRSFWWLKLLLVLILVAAGVIGGIMLSSQAITQQILSEFFPEYAMNSAEAPAAVETVAPVEKPIEFKPVESAIPEPSKAPVVIVSPEAEEKAEAEKDAAPAESAVPEESPAVSAMPESEESAATETVPSFAPVDEAFKPEEPVNVPKEPIGIDAALAAALDHAKLDESTVIVYGVSREKDDGIVYYEVEFAHGMIEYEYEINAYTGAVESWKTVRDKNPAAAAALQPATADSTAEAEYVSLADAKKAALEHAGYREHETTDMKVELEIDRNKVVYDVEFWAEGYDYDYKVDALSGLVIMVEKELGR